jgi:hypothetical protein
LCSDELQLLFALFPSPSNSRQYTKNFDELGITYHSQPNSFQPVPLAFVGIGFLCTSELVFPNRPCSDFTRTLRLPPTLSDGNRTSAFALALVGLCSGKQTLDVAVATESETNDFSIDCATFNKATITELDFVVIGLSSTDVIQSVTITSTFIDYGVFAVALGSDCMVKASKGSKGSKGSGSKKSRGTRG